VAAEKPVGRITSTLTRLAPASAHSNFVRNSAPGASLGSGTSRCSIGENPAAFRMNYCEVREIAL
jgi:hypothetical protein